MSGQNTLTCSLQKSLHASLAFYRISWIFAILEIYSYKTAETNFAFKIFFLSCLGSGSIKFQLQNKLWPPIEIVSSDDLISFLLKKNPAERTGSYRIAIPTI